MKTRHGHYSDKFEEEAKRIKQLCKEKLAVDVTWTEATSIAALRSKNTFMTDLELKNIISKLRGL